MKKSILLLAVLTGLAFGSCSKDDDSGNGGNNPNVGATVEKLVGTWKLTSATFNGEPDAIGDCPFVLKVSETTVLFELFSGQGCDEISTFMYDYVLEGSLVKLTDEDGGGDTYEITALTGTTLKLKYIDEGTVEETYTKQ